MSATVVSVSEIIGTAGEVTGTATTFTRVYLVKLSAADSAGQDIAMNATGVPAIGAAWPRVVAGRSTPTARSKKARLHDAGSRLLWQVEVDYSNASGSAAGATNGEKAPWLRASTYSSKPAYYDLALERDLSSEKVLVRNSAGDAFDPIPTTQRANRVITITRNRLYWSETNAEELQNTVNRDAITLRNTQYAPGTLRLINWGANSAEWTSENGATIPYYEETIEIEVATGEKGHKLSILDQGYNYLDGEEVKRATDDSPQKRPLPEPVLLNGSGGLGSSESPEFLDFEQYASEGWAVLGTL